ncbi:S9 family peptidase [Flavobacterium cupreum]|uniref:S9 family peptidase n=3 Tax=Flavobacterium TaxID=237 RepID=A0A434A7D6_9FLAO|nr:prolyl oligopeptidase family serine peptidase [Flavobacterium cupreum]RUT70265.1 S9 family peptidase [Flavobacterium cupreum]
MKHISLFRYVFFFYSVMITCPVMGQVMQKDLTPADYNLWSRLSVGTLSENGKWASFNVSYENGADTLFVKRTDGKSCFDFAQGQDGRFFGKDKFACLKSGLCIANLQTGNLKTVSEVIRYEITKENYIIAESPFGNVNKNLTIYNEEGNIYFDIKNVTAWSYNVKSDAIIYQTNDTGSQAMLLLRLSKNFLITKIAKTGETAATNFTWQDNGESVAFLKNENENTSIGLYRLNNANYMEINKEYVHELDSNKVFTSLLRISPDGQKVFFEIGNNTFDQNNNDIEIWNTEDKVVYPSKVMTKGYELIDKTISWEPDRDSYQYLTNNELPHCIISADGRHALVWNPNAYQPQQKQIGDTDYYLLDIETRDKKLFLAKQSGDTNQISFSPNSNFVTYFREKQWWNYNISTGETISLTAKLKVSFEDERYDWAGDVPPYGTAEWTYDELGVLVHDAFDIWKIVLNGKSKRLTNGRETNTIFRIVTQNKKEGFFYLSKEQWLTGTTGNRTVYYRWNAHSTCKPLIYDGYSQSELKVNAKGDAKLFVEQNYNLPPRLMYQNNGVIARSLYQSNPQHFGYKWGKAVNVTYSNSKGQQLQGTLYYPAGFNSTKLYPVIVNIYEYLSKGFYEYVNPTLHNQTGYNKSNYISQGYFVFEPDIHYEMGNPGLSAVDCVTAGVNAILHISGIDSKRIGLIGHSFGGYQANMIITRTNLFATAVVGAGISDLTTHFLCINENRARQNNYHFESGQFRMNGSLFELAENYAANSPLNFVKNVDTPLLLWTGRNDRQVLPSQSMEFHLALRRLEKSSVMLVYPEETHAMKRKADQEDLTIRIMEWFDHFLKDKPALEWMKPDKI